ncbi:MAG: hypothetical protein ABI459_07135, partial [Deltaproteobacteria bacterium]
TGLDHDDFATLHSHSSIDDVAAMRALPRAMRIADLTRDELVDIARRALDVVAWDSQYYRDLLDANVTRPHASNLIFYPPEVYDGDIGDYDPTPEDIIEWAMTPSNVIAL